jgi:hypothetical protein
MQKRKLCEAIRIERRKKKKKKKKLENEFTCPWLRPAEFWTVICRQVVARRNTSIEYPLCCHVDVSFLRFGDNVGGEGTLPSRVASEGAAGEVGGCCRLKSSGAIVNSHALNSKILRFRTTSRALERSHR